MRQPLFSASLLNALVALWLATVANLPAHLHMLKLGAASHVGFVLALVLMLWAIYTLIFEALAVWVWQKPLLIFMTLLSSSLVFAYLKFGTTASVEVVLSLFETTRAESMVYLSPEFLGWFVLTGILPSLCIGWVRIKKSPSVLRTFASPHPVERFCDRKRSHARSGSLQTHCRLWS